jgi:hypothetical protein
MAKNKKNGSKSGKQKKTAETKPETNAETTAEAQTATKEADKKPDTKADKKADKKADTKAKDHSVKGYGHGKTDWSGWEMLALAGVLFVCVVGLLALMLALSPGY